ncbi:MAG: hypothetical protein WCI93_02090, partial [bacterium]
FIQKKYINGENKKGQITIYYSISDIFIGIMLIGLVAFFINDYLSHSLGKKQSNCTYAAKYIINAKKGTLVN